MRFLTETIPDARNEKEPDIKPEYFPDTDTLYLNLSSAAANGGEADASEVADPEDFVFLLDASGRVVGIRIERARHRVDVEELVGVQVATDDPAFEVPSEENRVFQKIQPLQGKVLASFCILSSDSRTG